MDVWTWNELEKQGIDPNTACDICPCNQGIDRGDAYTQGPCGQKQCWFTLGADDEDEQKSTASVGADTVPKK